jgi:hypothetical protein
MSTRLRCIKTYTGSFLDERIGAIDSNRPSGSSYPYRNKDWETPIGQEILLHPLEL